MPAKQQSDAELELELMETLEDTRSSAQFILKSLMIAFEMKMKQAAALLQDNQKYLFHICVKGMKGNNFTRVKQWYQLILPYAGHLVHLINEELSNHAIMKPARPNAKGGSSRNLFRSLNILKGGFYSHDEGVARCCISLFQTMIGDINMIGGDIVGQHWEWFVTSTAQQKKPAASRKYGIRSSIHKTPQPLNQSPPRGKSSPPRKGNSPDKKLGAKSKSIAGRRGSNPSPPPEAPEEEKRDEFELILEGTGLHAVSYVFQNYESTKESASTLILLCSKFNAVELFTSKLPAQMESWSEQATFCQGLFQATC